MCYYFTSGSREINPNLSQALIAEERMLCVIMHYYCAALGYCGANWLLLRRCRRVANAPGCAHQRAEWKLAGDVSFIWCTRPPNRYMRCTGGGVFWPGPICCRPGHERLGKRGKINSASWRNEQLPCAARSARTFDLIEIKFWRSAPFRFTSAARGTAHSLLK